MARNTGINWAYVCMLFFPFACGMFVIFEGDSRSERIIEIGNNPDNNVSAILHAGETLLLQTECGEFSLEFEYITDIQRSTMALMRVRFGDVDELREFRGGDLLIFDICGEEVEIGKIWYLSYGERDGQDDGSDDLAHLRLGPIAHDFVIVPAV